MSAEAVLMGKKTATSETREHYLRPEVREIIIEYAMPEDGPWRSMNGDFHAWYRHRKSESRPGKDEIRLLNSTDDYEVLADNFRTFYQSLNVFSPDIWMETRPRELVTSERPLGTPADTLAYTLGVDIDKIGRASCRERV
jgi:hypothetical protein